MADDTAWKVPTVTDLRTVLMQNLQVPAGTIGAASDRTSPLLQMMIDRVRGAVLAGGRTPLSQTANSIPPEAVFHCMVITARALIDSVPQMARAAKINDDFTRVVYYSEQWLHQVEQGKPVTPPSLPVEDDEVATAGGANWGSTEAVSMGTD